MDMETENNRNTEITENGAPKKKRKLFIVWISLFIVCLLVAATCLGVWVYHIILRRAMEELYDQARVDISDIAILPKPDPDAAIGEETSLVPTPDTDSGEEETDGLQPLAIINFDILRETAPHVYAWIEIPGTDVAFPIVQHPKNNGYYLRRAVNGAYDVTGCIYTQNYNSLDFSDKNTLIYGHYMYDGTKFGPLISYMDEEFFEDHRRIDIYTEDMWYTYEVFAALPFDTRHVLLSYKHKNDPFAAFIDDIYASDDARAVFADGDRVDPEKDRIITLSTCLKDSSRRYLVLAKLTKSQLCE